MYSTIEQLEKYLSFYKDYSNQYHKTGDANFENQMDAAVMKLRYILRTLSLDACASDYQRYMLLSALDKLRLELGDLLLDSIMDVWGKVHNDCRDKFIRFCIQNNEQGDVSSYCRCIDFRRPTSCVQIAKGTVLYQWCKWKLNGEPIVGQWFTWNEVEPAQLGLSVVFDVMDGDDFEGHGTRVLCQFEFPFTRDCFQSIAAGTVDTWSAQKYSDGSPIDGQGLWGGGGAEQIFVPLSAKEKKGLPVIEMSDPALSKIDKPVWKYRFIRQW